MTPEEALELLVKGYGHWVPRDWAFERDEDFEKAFSEYAAERRAAYKRMFKKGEKQWNAEAWRRSFMNARTQSLAEKRRTEEAIAILRGVITI